MTGKGNFDIAENITLSMIESFQKMNGMILLLLKNSVIKNIVYEQKNNLYNISSIEKYCINSKREFNVYIEASLFYCRLNLHPTLECTEFDFYNKHIPQLKFGWLKDKFVSNIDTYIHTNDIDGVSPFIWRQGLKHDCSKIMELTKNDNGYMNGLNERINIEEDLVYGLLKSSDLKNTVIQETRKFTIVTQKKIGQETKFIETTYPITYQYLIQHQEKLKARKSSIYINKPLFSIFGIGDYSFKPYKIAISGLYKTFHFTLILPQNRKPIMLDDTCYFLGFEKLEFAIYTLILLNSPITISFLKSITFLDAKRTFTKEILMRIDLYKIAQKIKREILCSEIQLLNEKYYLHVTLELWELFIHKISPPKNDQFLLFA